MITFCLVKSHIFKTQRNCNNACMGFIRAMPVKGLYGNGKFHIPLWSMIYVGSKFIFSVSEIEF